MKLAKKFMTDEVGMETVEWAIMAALIVAGLVLVIQGIGSNVNVAFTRLQAATTP